jgi:large subunit ribosomal protein L2
MGLKSYKPVTPGTRFAELLSTEEVAKKRPERSLIEPRASKAGRNAMGRVTIRHRGGGHKKFYRIVDFKRDKHGVEAKVVAIEYDPNRSANLALLQYADGEKRYILCPVGLKVGSRVMSGPEVEPLDGCSLPLGRIPLGLPVHNIELYPGRGGKLVRGAGMSAQIMAREGDYCHVRLPSGEVRMINAKCYATVGQVGNIDHENISFGKAGRKRWLGWRPTVRGVAMNPIDHPMGGGEGRTSGGGHPVSPWGKLAKGKKTRRPRRHSDRFILQRRK